MILSPGSRRQCALPVPEEILLKFSLLGLNLIWDHSLPGWRLISLANAQHGLPYLIRSVFIDDVLLMGWDSIIGDIADQIAKPAQPVGWRNTQQIEQAVEI